MSKVRSIARSAVGDRPELLNELDRLRHRLDRRGRRRSPYRYEVTTLEPSGPTRGRVLLSMLNQPVVDPALRHDRSHTNRWETWCQVETWNELGFTVDVISWENDRFRPAHDYDVCIDARLNLERFDRVLGPDCIRLMHIDTSHWLFHQTAQHQRLSDLRDRRGVALAPVKEIAPNRAIEVADHGILLGNDATAATFAFAGTPLHRLPISTPVTYDRDDTKDWSAARRRFCWFGSEGAVHKGLDLVLDVFVDRPDLHLTVCGPVTRERGFVEAYHRELHETPNIELAGFVDVAGEEFARIRHEVGAVVYPSCSEGQNGGVVTCLHGQMIPVVTPETGVDVDGFGTVVERPTVAGLGAAVTEITEADPADLSARALRGWEHVRAHHTRERYAERYREIAEHVLDTGRTR